MWLTEQQDVTLSSDDVLVSRNRPSLELSSHGFQLSDAMYFCRRGMEVTRYSYLNFITININNNNNNDRFV